ncbi:MAG: hypothetical protein DBY00_07030 [Flavobacteriales bacterium]|nr:MAG: hypothetical protein DBY00_07030 [Flavobacteriales bacterium]
MILQSLFSSLSDFARYASGADMSLPLPSLESSAVPAKKQVCNIISPGVYDLVIASDGQIKEAVRQAVANLTLFFDVPFYVQRKRTAGIEVYKNEAEGMKRSYIDTYYSAMDTILLLLDSSSGDISEAWQQAPYCAIRDKVRIKTVEEFNLVYHIDNSYLFFFRTLPIQLELLDNMFFSYYDRLGQRADLLPRLDRALVMLIIATAIRRFDPIELPATIRNLFSDTTASRSGDKEQSRLLQLADELSSEAMSAVSLIDASLSESSNVADPNIDRHPDDKFYFMP